MTGAVDPKGLSGVPAEEARSRVAIVGAGVSGIVAARALRAAGFDVTVFEKAPDVGGVWSATRAYPGIATQDDRSSYAFSSKRMPPGVAEHPAGADVRAYLAEYLADGVPLESVRLGTRVLGADLIGDTTWRIDSEGPGGRFVEEFDWLVAANGTFSTPHVPAWSGRAAFEAAGGRVMTPAELGDGAALEGVRTVVVGWGKSACDIAAYAGTRSASTAVIARTLTWKYPKRLGLGRLTFHHLVLTRAGERLIATRYRDDDGKVLWRRIPERLPRVLLGRVIARAIDRATGLSGLGLRPDTEVRTSNSLVSDGFFEGVAEGRIRVHRERLITRLGGDEQGPWAELSDGSRLPADVVVAATGYVQRVEFLSQAVVARGLADDGGLLLHRRVLAVDVPRLAFVGWAHSFRSPLTSEIAANWLAAAMVGRVGLPSRAWQRRHSDCFSMRSDRQPTRRPAVLPAVTMSDLDVLLHEMGVRLPLRVRLKQVWRPLDPADYDEPLQRAQQAVGVPATANPRGLLRHALG